MSEVLQAALDYAARGWPVFPCHPETKRPLVGALPGEPKGSGGLKRATTSAEVITSWWTKWPKAMIGLPTGPLIGAFVIDVDAGADKDTGEVFDADALLAALEGQVGELPETWTVETPRGGRHLYFYSPFLDRIGNRAGLIGPKSRIDVRGDGGYVIAPPSVRDDGKAYRWMVEPRGEPERATAELADCVLRLGKWDRAAEAAKLRTEPASTAPAAIAEDAALRKYALSAFDAEVRRVAQAPSGAHNSTLNEAAFALGQLVGAGVLAESMVRAALVDATKAWGKTRHSASHSLGTINNGLSAGAKQPRDLAEVKARTRPSRSGARLRGPLAGNLPPIETRGEERSDREEKKPSDQLELRDIMRQQRRRDEHLVRDRLAVRSRHFLVKTHALF